MSSTDPSPRGERLRALVDGFATADLRRVQAGWASASVGNWGLAVILSIYAYDVGGAGAIGLAGGLRLVAASAAAPFASALVDRHSRPAVIQRCLYHRALSLAALTAVVAVSGPLAAVIVLATAYSVLSTVHRPAQAALLPSLARTPQQLAAANAVLSAVGNGGFLVGALAGGVLAAVVSPTLAFAMIAATFLLAAFAQRGLPHDAPPPYAPSEADLARQAVAGARRLVASRQLLRRRGRDPRGRARRPLLRHRDRRGRGVAGRPAAADRDRGRVLRRNRTGARCPAHGDGGRDRPGLAPRARARRLPRRRHRGRTAAPRRRVSSPRTASPPTPARRRAAAVARPCRRTVIPAWV